MTDELKKAIRSEPEIHDQAGVLALSEKLERAERVIKAALETRKAQKVYFRDRGADALDTAKNWERELDKALAAYFEKPAEPGLFDAPAARPSEGGKFDFKRAAAFLMPWGAHKGRTLDEIASDDQGLQYLDYLRGERESLPTSNKAVDRALCAYLDDPSIKRELEGLGA